MGIEVVLGLAAGLVVLAIAVNAMVKSVTGKSNAKIDAIEAKVAAKLDEVGAKLNELTDKVK